MDKKVVAEKCGIQNARIAVKRNGRPFLFAGLHAFKQHFPIDQIAQFLLHAITSHRGLSSAEGLSIRKTKITQTKEVACGIPKSSIFRFELDVSIAHRSPC